MTTLAQLVETLGPAILEKVEGTGALDMPVTGVVVHDRSDGFEIRRGDLVLGVGADSDPPTSESLIDAAIERGAAGLALRASVVNDRLRDRFAESDTGLLRVSEGASWSQIVYLTQSVLSHGNFSRDDEQLGGVPAGDLFAFADAIAALISAPVTIEDRLSNVLAFSADQQSADAQRMETVLGRRVPPRYLQRLEDLGVFKRLDRGEAVYVDSFEAGMLPRFVVPVQAGDDLLGSIWAAVEERPSPSQESALLDVAKLAALHLLRHRAGLDIERNLQSDLVMAILQGSGSARESAERLGLTKGGYRVLAIASRGSDEVEDERLSLTLRDAVSVHLSRLRVPGAAAAVGGVVLTIVTCGARSTSEGAVRRLAENLLVASTSAPDLGVIVGIGGHAESISEVPRSAEEAEAALGVLRAGRHRMPVATIDDVRVQVLLARFARYAAEEKEMYEASVKELLESDSSNGTSYIETLRVYLEEFGDIVKAAERLHVHPNTLRYRLRKIQALSHLNLDDHHDRLALMLLLSVVLPGEG